MLLTITSTSPPATDLGFLLHKNPAAVRSADVGFGMAHAFYPAAEADRCTIALLVEVDPVALVRRSRGGPFPLAAYVNDRPYAASSFLSVALQKMFGTALRGQCKERPGLPEERLELSAWLPVLPCRGGEELLRRLFEPLGYQVSARPIPLDPQFPQWGDSPYFDVALSARCRVRDLLGQLYVLLPVLDDDKHYWVTRDEIDKLVASAGEWLAGHPERDVIVRRYLRHQPQLAAEAIARLLDEDSGGEAAADIEAVDAAEGPAAGEPAGAAAERPAAGAAGGPAASAAGGPVTGEHARLRDLRLAAVLAALKASGARRVLDLGCGDGRLLAGMLRDGQFEEIVGVDASAAALERAARRLRLDEMAPRQRARIRLLQGALTYSDRRLAGYDAAVLMEVIEHIDPDRLGALEQAVFGGAAPAAVVVTTPNAEYNARYPGLAPGARRHPDHRFEWGRAEFRGWAEAVAGRHGYTAAFEPVGAEDSRAGPPTQLAVLARCP
jgi:3' terminal RNA ribose 2'-O-methyltransferase Hen1